MVFQKGHKINVGIKRNFTEEHKKNISLAKKGKPNPKLSLLLKGRHTSPKTEFKKGMKIPKEWIEKRGSTYGKNNPNFKYDKSNPPLCKCGCGQPTHFNYILKRFCDYITGHNAKGKGNPTFNNWSSRKPYGIEFSPELKEKIRQRDNHTCQECENHQKQLKSKLDIHHIDYNKKNNSSLNLISLCRKCHMKTGFNRKHWKQYFKMKIFLNEFFDPNNILVWNENHQLIGMGGSK